MNIYMQKALEQAKTALDKNEVPVGAVIVFDGKIIAQAHNLKEALKDPTAHAEILAIRKAAEVLGNWRLTGCDIYITLEPCPMCAWAIGQARLRRVYFGSYDREYGAAGSRYDLLTDRCEVYCGICEDACNELLNSFFEAARRS